MTATRATRTCSVSKSPIVTSFLSMQMRALHREPWAQGRGGSSQRKRHASSHCPAHTCEETPRKLLEELAERVGTTGLARWFGPTMSVCRRSSTVAGSVVGGARSRAEPLQAPSGRGCGARRQGGGCSDGQGGTEGQMGAHLSPYESPPSALRAKACKNGGSDDAEACARTAPTPRDSHVFWQPKQFHQGIEAITLMLVLYLSTQ